MGRRRDCLGNNALRRCRGARSVERCAGAALGHHDVDGVALDGEVGGRGGRDLAVEVHRQRLVGDQPDTSGGQVVHPVVFDEASVLEQPCDTHVLPQWPRQDRVDVQGVVVDPCGGGDRVAAAVVPAVADGYLEQILELQRLVVALRELEAGPEWLVPGMSPSVAML